VKRKERKGVRLRSRREEEGRKTEPTFQKHDIPDPQDRRVRQRPNEHRLKPCRNDHLGINLTVDLENQRPKKNRRVS